MSKNESVVLIGKKPTMNYALAAIVIFNKGSKKVTIKARGRAISKAVDVAEIVKQKFLQGTVKVESIITGTETFEVEGRKKTVSTIEITLSI
ncbi:MAG: DNA-binding protein Alba [Candidatus Odinarchaeia archaeon]